MRDVHPGSGYTDLGFLPIPDPGSRGQKGTGSRIRIRNTDIYRQWRLSGIFPLHLPAGRFHCVRGYRDWTQDYCNVRIWQSGALTARLDLIHKLKLNKWIWIQNNLWSGSAFKSQNGWVQTPEKLKFWQLHFFVDNVTHFKIKLFFGCCLG
jgi:hypothetical protein